MNSYLQKRNEYLGLAIIPILITDQSDHSDYFNVSNLEMILTGGKNAFKVTGNHQLLVKGSEIKVELTDLNGTPIFHTVNRYRDNLDRRLVTVWVFEDTPPGPVFVTLVGIAKTRPNGRSIPKSWEGRPNVRWRRRVEVEPFRINNTPILFNRTPRVFLSEVERGAVSQSYNTGSGMLAQYSGTTGFHYQRGGQNTGQITFDPDDHLGSITSEMIGGMISVKPPASVNAAFSSPTSPPEGFFNITDIPNAQTAMISPGYNYLAQMVQRSQVGQNLTQTVTAAPQEFFATEFTISYHQAPATYTTSSTVNSYANIILANIDPMCGDVASIKAFMREVGTSQWYLADEQIIESKELFVDTANIFDRHPIGKFLTITTYNEYWETNIYGSGTAPTVTRNDVELMNSLQISGSEALLGAADRANSYIKFSSTTNRPIQVFAGDRYYVSMRLKSQGVIDAISGQQSRPKIRVMMSGSGVSPDSSIFNGLEGKEVRTIQAPNPPTPTPSNASNPAFPTFPAVVYSPAILNAAPAQLTANQVNNTQALSRTANVTTPQAFPVAPMTPTGQQINQISLPATNFALPTSTVQTGNAVGPTRNPTFAQTAAANPAPSPNYDMSGQTFAVEFTADADGTIVPAFLIEHGTWWIADVSIQARAESGFTPNHTFMEANISSLGFQNSRLDFKFEFYNPVGVRADYIHYEYDSDFAMLNGLNIANGTTEIIGTMILGNGIILQGVA